MWTTQAHSNMRGEGGNVRCWRTDVARLTDSRGGSDGIFAGFPKSGPEIDLDVCSICDGVGRQPNTFPPPHLASWSLCIKGAHWHAEWQTGRWEEGEPDRPNSQLRYKLGSLKRSHQTKSKSRFPNLNTYLNLKAYFLYTFLRVWVHHGQRYYEECISWRDQSGSCKNVSTSFAMNACLSICSSVPME